MHALRERLQRRTVDSCNPQRCTAGQIQFKTCFLREGSFKVLPGQYFDKETNLHYNMARDYDPAIGRYIQSDPISLAGGINTYSYVGSNPLSYIDALGLKPRGTWINGTPSPGSGSFSNFGASWMSPRFDPWDYLQVARLSGTVSGTLLASVKCTDDENCYQQSWEMHHTYSASVNGSVGVGPNLYATAIGARFGPWAA